jgi:hypothetical protein
VTDHPYSRAKSRPVVDDAAIISLAYFCRKMATLPPSSTEAATAEERKASFFSRLHWWRKERRCGRFLLRTLPTSEPDDATNFILVEFLRRSRQRLPS